MSGGMDRDPGTCIPHGRRRCALCSTANGDGWIACSERMPAQLTPILVATDIGDGGPPLVRGAFLCGDNWRDQSATKADGEDGEVGGRVYAWRPLPAAPPREKQA